jgi:hypothetical protein
MLRYCRQGAFVCGLAVAGLLLAAPLWAADVERATNVDKLLPNDTESVMAVNLRQIIDSPLVKKLGLDHAKQALKDQTDIQKVLDDLGFNVFTDVDNLLVAGCGATEADKDRVLMIVHGKFDIPKFEAKAAEVAEKKKDVVKIHKVTGSDTKLYEVTPEGSPQSFFVAFASKTTVVASPGKDYVLDALDKEAGKRKTELKNKDLKAVLGRVDDKQSMWTVVLGSTVAKSPLADDPMAKEIIDRIQDADLGITIDKDIKVQLGITAKTAEDAKKLDENIVDGMDQLRGILALLSQNNKDLKPLLNVLKAVKPSTKGKTITIVIEVPGELLENAAKKINKP